MTSNMSDNIATRLDIDHFIEAKRVRVLNSVMD